MYTAWDVYVGLIPVYWPAYWILVAQENSSLFLFFFFNSCDEQIFLITYIYIFSVICHSLTYFLPSLSCFDTRISKIKAFLMVSLYFLCSFIPRTNSHWLALPLDTFLPSSDDWCHFVVQVGCTVIVLNSIR